MDAIVDILGGTIGNLVIGLVQVIVTLVCTFFVSCLAAIAELFLQAMAVTPTQIESWLGAPLTTGGFAELITYSGLGIAMLFAIWELCRGLMASIQGDNPPMRPYVVGMRFLIFGAWAFGGIPFSKIIFDIGSRIYQSVPFDSVSGGVVSEINSLGDNLITGFGSWLDSWNLTLVGGVSWASAIIGRILTTLLIVFAMLGFLKLLFTCSQRYVNMIFYTYFSPLAIACGVSSSWSKVTWTWLKTLLSTLVLWVLDVWCIFGGLNLLRASANAMANQANLIAALSCMLVTYGFMKGAVALDGIMSQFGATVTKTTGSLMGDMRDMMIMGHIAGGAVKGVSRFAQGSSIGLTRGSGLGNASNYKNLGFDKLNQGAARSKLETLRDSLIAGAGATRTGGAILGAANMAAGLPKAIKRMATEAREAKMGRDKMNFAKDVGSLTNKYAGQAGAKGKGKTTADNLPKKGTAAAAEYGKELQGLLDKYGEKGLGLKDLMNDPNVMQDLAKNTLLDPKHPELGTMEDNGFKCVGYNPGENGVGKAMFDKVDDNGRLQERREVGHMRFGAVAQPATQGKSLGHGIFAGKPAKQMFSGDVSSMQLTESKGGAQVDISGVDAAGKPINKSISAIHGKSLNGSQAVMVSEKNSAGIPEKQSEYTLKPGKTVRDGAEALATGNMESAFVTKKNPKTGEVSPVVANTSQVNAKARAVGNTFHTLSDARGPIEFSEKALGAAAVNANGGKFFVNAGTPDKEGNVALAAVSANDPTKVVARGSISQKDLEAAYGGNAESLSNAMANAFSPVAPTNAEGGNGPSAKAEPTNEGTTPEHNPPVASASGGTAPAPEMAHQPPAQPSAAPVTDNEQAATNASSATNMSDPGPTVNRVVTDAASTPEVKVDATANANDHRVNVSVNPHAESTVEKAENKSEESGGHMLFGLMDGHNAANDESASGYGENDRDSEDVPGNSRSKDRKNGKIHGYNKRGKNTFPKGNDHK